MSRLLVDSAWTLVAEVVTGVATLAGGVFIARATGAEGKGVFTLATGFAAIGAGVIGLRWERPTGYFIARNPKDLPAIVGSVVAVATLSTLSGIILWRCWPSMLSSTVLRGMDARCITLATCLIGTHFLFVNIPAIYGGLREFRARSLFVSASAVPLLLSAALLSLVGEHRIAAFLSWYLVACAAMYGGWLIVITITRSGAPRLDRDLLKRMVRYGSLSYVALLMDFITVRLDMFLLNYLISASEVGVYSVAIGIAARMAGLPNVISHVVFHRVSANEIGSGATTARILRLTTFAMIVSGGLIAAVASFLIVPFYGSDFRRSGPLLLVMIPASIFWGLFRLLASDIEGRGRPGIVSMCSFVGSVSIVVLDVWWIPRYGAMGAAWASLIAYGVTFACAMVAFARVTGIRLYSASAATSGDVVALAGALGRAVRGR